MTLIRAVTLVALLACMANADTFTFRLDNVLWPYPDPVWAPGADHSISATFTDTAPNQVSLTMDASNLSPNRGILPQLIQNWWFNVVDGVSLSSLSFNWLSGQRVQSGGISVGQNSFLADANGFFDIRFSWGTFTRTFRGGQTSVYQITGPGLQASDFVAVSQTVLGINDPSFSVAQAYPSYLAAQVPEPTSMLLLGTCLIGIGALLRRRLN